MAIEKGDANSEVKQKLERSVTLSKNDGIIKNLMKYVRNIVITCLGLLGTGDIGCAHIPTVVLSAPEISQRQACVIFVHRNDSLDKQVQEELFESIKEYLRDKYSNIRVTNIGLIGEPKYLASSLYNSHSEAGELVDRYIQKYNVKLVENEQCDDIIGIEFLKYLEHTKCYRNNECGTLYTQTRLYIVNTEHGTVVTDIQYSHRNARTDPYFGDLDKTLIEDYTEDINDLLGDKLLTSYQPDKLSPLLKNAFRKIEEYYASLLKQEEISESDLKKFDDLVNSYLIRHPDTEYEKRVIAMSNNLKPYRLYHKELHKVPGMQKEFIEVVRKKDEKDTDFFKLAFNFRKKYRSALLSRYIAQLHEDLVKELGLQQVILTDGRIRILKKNTDTANLFFEQGETILISKWIRNEDPFSSLAGHYFAFAISLDGSKKGVIWGAEIDQPSIPKPPPIKTPEDIVYFKPGEDPGPSRTIELGMKLMIEAAIRSAPQIYEVTHKVAVELYRIAPDAFRESKTGTLPGNGELNIYMGTCPGLFHGYCNNTAVAIRLSDRSEYNCFASAGPNCLITNLLPDNYEVYVNCPFCEIKKTGPVKVTVEPNSILQLDFRSVLNN